MEGEGQACAAAPSHAMCPSVRWCCELGCLWAYHLGSAVTAVVLLTKRKVGGPLDKVCEGVCGEPPKLVSARLARTMTCNGHLSNTLQEFTVGERALLVAPSPGKAGSAPRSAASGSQAGAAGQGSWGFTCLQPRGARSDARSMCSNWGGLGRRCMQAGSMGVALAEAC